MHRHIAFSGRRSSRLTAELFAARALVVVATLATVVTASTLTITNTSAASTPTLAGIVNTYEAVTAISGPTLTLDGVRTGAPTPFTAGDQVLVIQMTGTNPAATTSSLGAYEVATVGAATGTSLTLTASLSRTYVPATEHVQVVRMVGGPGVATLGGTVTALPWNGRTGGVVALAASQVNLGGLAIDVTGDGFTNAAVPNQSVLTGNAVAAGATSGRGASGSAGLSLAGNGSGQGGGGVGGAGGAGGTSASNGGSIGGGNSPAGSSAVAIGTNGGAGAPQSIGQTAFGGSGGGGGVIGGGGGGGGGNSLVSAPGGGGGVSGGGGGGHAGVTSTNLDGGGGGGVGSVGNGADGQPGGWLFSDGSAGGGGGSYGGGGASGGLQGLLTSGSGGGGGGSWTGGGAGGAGNTALLGSVGGSGNAAVGTTIPDSANYLNDTDPRLIMGGAGGRGSSDSGSLAGGAGGGIVFLQTGSLVGGGTVRANGGAGLTPTSGVHSGSGGGAGGQIRVIDTGSIATGLKVTADGGAAGRPSGSLFGSGAPGGGGGAGGVWLEIPSAAKACGTDANAIGVQTSVAGGASPRALITGVGGGNGGTGLVCASDATTYAVGDQVWQDRNADGIQEVGEPGVPGVTVTLSSATTGAVVATTVTDSAGRYLFDRLPTGSYRVAFGLPANCAYTVTGRGGPTTDSDADPFSGITPPISLAPGGANLRSPVAGDGSVQASSLNPTVDAGLVCSTSSTTLLGGYVRGALTDLQLTQTSVFDGASGAAVLSAGLDGQSTSLLLEATGVSTAGAGQTFAARLNFGRCIVGFPLAAGMTYNTDLLQGHFPPVVSPQTEAWLDLSVNSSGQAIATTTVPFIPSAAARSIVIYSGPTAASGLPTGAEVACVPLVIG